MSERKRPESVVRMVEEKCEGEIFLDEGHLVIVKSPSREVIDIPMKDIVKLKRGKMRLIHYYGRAETAVQMLAYGRRLVHLATETIPTLKITYSTKPGLTSTVTLAGERKICPRCGKKMSLVAAGWYCMKDDYLIAPQNDLGQMIESKRSAKDTSWE